MCSHLRESSNEVWSGFAASCGGHGLVATSDCETFRRDYCECGAGTGIRGVRFQLQRHVCQSCLLLHVRFESTVQLSHKRFDLRVEAHYFEALWKDAMKDF